MRTPSSPSEVTAPLHASIHAPLASLQTRPPYGSTVSHRRRHEPRAGSPSFWVPRLAVHPLVHETNGVTGASAHIDPRKARSSGPYNPTLSTQHWLPYASCSQLPPTTYTQARERDWEFPNSTVVMGNPTRAPSCAAEHPCSCATLQRDAPEPPGGRPRHHLHNDVLTSLRAGGPEGPHQRGHCRTLQPRSGADLLRGTPLFLGTRGTMYYGPPPFGRAPDGT